MTKITITEQDLKEKEYTILKRIKGQRFELETKIKAYFKKSDGDRIFLSLTDFFLTQQIVYDKLHNNESSIDLNLASSLASLVALEKLNYIEEENCDFFDNKKVDYSRILPIPATDALELYLRGMEEIRPIKSLDSITSSFFNWILRSSCQEIISKNNSEEAKKYNFKIKEKEYNINPEEYKTQAKGQKSTFNASHYVVKPALTLPKTTIPTSSKLEPTTPKIIQPQQIIQTPKNDYIYGHEKVKQEFYRISTLVQHRDYFQKLFDPKKIFHNYILVGPPGTGKTTLINNLANQCGLAFMNIPCVELCSEYFSKSAANVHEVYASAKKIMEKDNNYGVIIFFDEFDHIAKRRGYGNSTENDSLITTLNANLDGSSSHAGIITFAATNVEEMLDPAILSRFTKLFVGYPQTDKELIGIHNTIIHKIEEYAKQKLFETIDYNKILPFPQKDERYKSGRVIDRILYNVAIEKSISSLEKGHPQLVTTDDLLRVYTSYDLEQETKYDPAKNLTKTK